MIKQLDYFDFMPPKVTNLSNGKMDSRWASRLPSKLPCPVKNSLSEALAEEAKTVPTITAVAENSLEAKLVFFQRSSSRCLHYLQQKRQKQKNLPP